jgi:hypothetical protein
MKESHSPLLLAQAMGLIVITAFWAWIFFPSEKRTKQTLKSWTDQGYAIEDYSAALKKTRMWLACGYLFILAIFVCASLLSVWQLLEN